jgi:hypothetical protein
MLLTHVCERARSLTQSAKRFAAYWAALAAAGLVGLVGAAALAGPALATSQPTVTTVATPPTATTITQPTLMPPSAPYTFTTLNNQADATFNQLLGINQAGTIAGYFGSGEQNHPNQGYLLVPPYGQANYTADNFPGSTQTQVTGLNDRGVTVGFWSDSNNADNMNANFGFYQVGDHRPHTVLFPTGDNSTPPVDQLLGVNDKNVAVGFYTDGEGNSHGFTYTIKRHRFHQVRIPGAQSVTAAAINNRGDIAGFDTDAQGNVNGFLTTAWGGLTSLSYPGAMSTQPLGVNDNDEVVGVYTNSDNSMHGFTWTPRGGFQTVDDPNGIGTTTINGVNDQGQLVGFYVDAAGNTDGLLAVPQRHHNS